MAPDPQTWFAEMPKITRFLFAGTFGLTLAAHFGAVSPYTLTFDPTMIWNKFHIWRLVTCGLFGGKLGFPFLINMYFLYSYSMRMETEDFEGRPADYVVMLSVCWVLMLALAYFFNLMIVGNILTMAIMYTWSQLHKEMEVSFYFGTRFKAMYLPWALLLFNILLGGSGMIELMGIATGHVYFMFKFVFPRDLGYRDFLETPDFLKHYFPEAGPGRATLGGTFGQAPATRAGNQPDMNRRGWGNGRRLGDN